jgi:hypothetical protein
MRCANHLFNFSEAQAVTVARMVFLPDDSTACDLGLALLQRRALDEKVTFRQQSARNMLLFYHGLLHWVYLRRIRRPTRVRPNFGKRRLFSNPMRHSWGVLPTEIAMRLLFDLIKTGSHVHLPLFTKKNAADYCKAARPKFIARYSRHFERHGRFRSYMAKEALRQRADYLPRTPGQMRKQIWRDIKQSFVTIAPRDL